MADVYNGIIGNDWVDASTLVAFDEGKDYLIQNQGGGILIAAVGSTAPEGKRGTFIPVMVQAHYKTSDGNLYLKAHAASCSINISEATPAE